MNVRTFHVYSFCVCLLVHSRVFEMFVCRLYGCAVPFVSFSVAFFTADGSRNPAESQPLSVPASPAAVPSLFPGAADWEAASRPANIGAAPVWSAGRWRDRREQSKWAIRNWIIGTSGLTTPNEFSHDVTGGLLTMAAGQPVGIHLQAVVILADLTREAEV